MELFSLVSRSLLDSIWIWSDDKVTDVSPIPGGPYLLLGCESGTCRVILVSSRGQLSLEEGAPASSLKQLPYQSTFLVFSYCCFFQNIDAIILIVLLVFSFNSNCLPILVPILLSPCSSGGRCRRCWTSGVCSSDSIWR